MGRICQIHSTPGKPANHTHREFWVFKQSGQLNAEHKGLDTPSEEEDEPQRQSTRKQKNFSQEVKTVNLLHVTKRMAPIKVRTIKLSHQESRHWSLKPIIFDQLDYSRNIKNTGQTALILDPIIDGFQFTNVLMDGGSGLNLIYQDTIHRMGINPVRIRYSKTTFQGVAPGPDTHCMGFLRLAVIFGSANNFPKLTFHVVP